MIRPVSRSAGSPGTTSSQGKPPGSPFSAHGIDSSPSAPALGRKSPSSPNTTKVATSGRDFLNSIYYDQYTKSSPGKIYDSNLSSRHVSTTIPTANAIFAASKKDTKTCKRQDAANIRLDPVLHLRSKFGHNGNRYKNRGGGGERMNSNNEEQGQEVRVDNAGYDEVLEYMKEHF